MHARYQHKPVLPDVFGSIVLLPVPCEDSPPPKCTHKKAPVLTFPLLQSHALFLLFFLSFQFTAIIGAGKVKGVVEDITGLSNTVSGKVDWNNIETTYPVLKPYLDKVGTKVDEVSDQKTSALSLINSIINGFMWRRAAWALGGVMICFVVAALPALTGNGRNRQGQRGASASTRHRTTQHTSRSHRPRRR